MARNVTWGFPRSRVTAHDSSAPSGSAEIRHPYHPLRGKRFPILKSRCVRGVDCLVLQGSESGTFSVARDWTDRAQPDAYRDANVAPCFLRVETLLQLLEIIDSQDAKIEVDRNDA